MKINNGVRAQKRKGTMAQRLNGRRMYNVLEAKGDVFITA
jgi:hypothetical protein